MSKKQLIGGLILLMIITVSGVLFHFGYWPVIIAFTKKTIATFFVKFMAKIVSMGFGGTIVMFIKRFTIDYIVTPFVRDNFFAHIKEEIVILVKYYWQQFRNTSKIKKFLIIISGGPIYIIWKFMGFIVTKLGLNKLFSILLIYLLSAKDIMLGFAKELIVPLLEFTGVWIFLDFLEKKLGDRYKKAKASVDDFLGMISRKLNLRLSLRLKILARKFKNYTKIKVGGEIVYKKILDNMRKESSVKEKEKAKKKVEQKIKINNKIKEIKQIKILKVMLILIIAYALLS